MKRRALGPVFAALGCGAGEAAAQDTPLRTAWGHPDLQGTWANATLTPLQRPVELGDKEFYTPDELAALATRSSSTRNFKFNGQRRFEGNLGLANILSGHCAEERAAAGP